MKKKNMKDSAISILHKLRKQFAEKQRFEKAVGTIMLCILLIEFAVAYFLKGQFYGTIAMFGVVATLGWLIYSTYKSIQLQGDIDNIDEFYLELEQEIIRQNETNKKNT